MDFLHNNNQTLIFRIRLSKRVIPFFQTIQAIQARVHDFAGRTIEVNQNKF